jgi:hypothetical protein
MPLWHWKWSSNDYMAIYIYNVLKPWPLVATCICKFHQVKKMMCTWYNYENKGENFINALKNP